jgi:hypothetical protein
VPDRVEQLRLAVVDVPHHGDDRRPGNELRLVAFVLAELDVERLEQLAVLVFRAHHLDVVVELGAEQLEGLVVDRLGRGDHLAEMEHDLHERAGDGPDLVREVGQRRATRKPDDLTVAAGNLHAADRRRLHVVEFLTPLLLGLATADRTSAAAAESACGAAAATATRSARTAGASAEAASSGPAGSAAAEAATTTATRRAGATAATARTAAAGPSAARAGAAAAGTLRHHAGARTPAATLRSRRH